MNLLAIHFKNFFSISFFSNIKACWFDAASAYWVGFGVWRNGDFKNDIHSVRHIFHYCFCLSLDFLQYTLAKRTQTQNQKMCI